MPRRPPILDPRHPVHRFALELRRLREQSGYLTLAELAEAMDCPRSAVAAYFNGARLPRLAQLIALVQACNGDLPYWQSRLETAQSELGGLADTGENYGIHGHVVREITLPYHHRDRLGQGSAPLPLTAGKVFISYVREDSVDVDVLQRALETARVGVWRDTSDLWPGDDWRAKIREAIARNALIFIACFSVGALRET